MVSGLDRIQGSDHLLVYIYCIIISHEKGGICGLQNLFSEKLVPGWNGVLMVELCIFI